MDHGELAAKNSGGNAVRTPNGNRENTHVYSGLSGASPSTYHRQLGESVHRRDENTSASSTSPKSAGLFAASKNDLGTKGVDSDSGRVLRRTFGVSIDSNVDSPSREKHLNSARDLYASVW